MRACFTQENTMDLTINGKAVQADAEPDMPLLWVLRDQLNLTGTKFGCGVALCGACTVHVDGQPVRSCVTPASALVGKNIRTIESLGSKGRSGLSDLVLGSVAHRLIALARQPVVLVK